MHEISLVRSLLCQVEQIAKEHNAIRITEIEVEIGPLSGVEPLLVESAFEQLAPSTPCSDASLIIQRVPLQLICGACQQTSETQTLKFRCPECGSSNVSITNGETFRLMNVTLDTP